VVNHQQNSEDDVAGPGREFIKTGMRMMARKRELECHLCRVAGNTVWSHMAREFQ